MAALVRATDTRLGRCTGLGPAGARDWPLGLAELCHRAEAGFVGVPVGMLDQLAVLGSRRGQAMLIDFLHRGLEWLPLTLGPLVVVDTGVRRRVDEGGYAERRRQCEEAAARLGVTNLRQATLDQVETRLDGVLRARARHVVTENERVLAAAARLRAGAGIGDLLWASHSSLRDDFAVSCPELDAVVEAAGRAGAGGARLTGAGFGGCAIVVGLSADEMTEALRGVAAPGVTAFAVRPSDGAGRVG